MKLFSVQDITASAFMNPATFRNTSEAIRSFSMECSDPKSMFNKFPQSYILFELGEWNELSGDITPHIQKIAVSTASEHVNLKS